MKYTPLIVTLTALLSMAASHSYSNQALSKPTDTIIPEEQQVIAVSGRRFREAVLSQLGYAGVGTPLRSRRTKIMPVRTRSDSTDVRRRETVRRSYSWSPMGYGFNDDVRALTTYKGHLIAAGDFSVVGSSSINRIASWNDSTWLPLGSGMDGTVYALTVYNGKLIAGGFFVNAGSWPSLEHHIAAWDGNSWLTLGSGMLGEVYALTVYNGRLIAGGRFSKAGGVYSNYIAAWDGSSWSPLGLGMDRTVYALTVYNGKLIAGGGFGQAGGVSANHIAAWDGSSWSPLGSGIGGGVSALTVYNGKLIAGGEFMQAGGVSASNIAAWDGSSWSSIRSHINNCVHALTVYYDQLIAGAAGATTCVAWDGSSWLPLGSRMNGEVFALTVYNGHVIVGGRFTEVGGVYARHIAECSLTQKTTRDTLYAALLWKGTSRGRDVLLVQHVELTRTTPESSGEQAPSSAALPTDPYGPPYQVRLLAQVVCGVENSTCIVGGTRCDLTVTPQYFATYQSGFETPADLRVEEEAYCVILRKLGKQAPLCEPRMELAAYRGMTETKWNRLSDAEAATTEMGKMCFLALPDHPLTCGLIDLVFAMGGALKTSDELKAQQWAEVTRDFTREHTYVSR